MGREGCVGSAVLVLLCSALFSTSKHVRGTLLFGSLLRCFELEMHGARGYGGVERIGWGG